MQITITLDTKDLNAAQKQALGTLVESQPGGTLLMTGSLETAPLKTVVTPAEEPEETVVEEEPEESGVTLADAKSLATKMVAAGEAKKVKEALASVGAKKVSEIPEDRVDEFVAALSAK